MGLIVDGLSAELSTKPQKVQHVMDFVTKELPRCDQDFTRLKASEKMVPLFYQMGSQQQAESILAKHNLAVFPGDESATPEKQQKIA